MPKLHEVLAAEKLPMTNWMTVAAETVKKFKNPANYFFGHRKGLHMLVESPENAAIEAAARDEKEVTTTVLETLRYALDLWGKAEDLQFAKNRANREACGVIMWRGAPLVEDVPVDELLGLESRLGKMMEIVSEMPTLDMTKVWTRNEGVWVTPEPDCTTKTDKVPTPVTLSEATDRHPAQVQLVNKDVVVGKYTTTYMSGAVTSVQKATMIQNLSELIGAVKEARMRANCIDVKTDKRIAATLIDVILGPLTK